MSVIDLHCPTDADTRAAARRLAALCRPADVVVLNGGLGVGKTAFAGGLAEGLGVEEPVTSPTFVLMRSYHSGFMPFIHVDVYRLGSIGEFEDLAAIESGEDGVVVIEWGGAVAIALPRDRLEIDLQRNDDESRTLILRPAGSWSTRALDEVAI
jgi:tRNA threonylcarbamoyladenosine biosynthesis protein TsaE